MATARLNGAETMQRALRKLGKEAPTVLGQALYAEASQIMAQSKLIVPVDTGALRSSGHVRLPEVVGSKVVVTLGYGGAAATYAVIVHEKVGARHKSPTRAKYLEEPFRAATQGMLGRLAGWVRRVLYPQISRRGT